MRKSRLSKSKQDHLIEHYRLLARVQRAGCVSVQALSDESFEIIGQQT